MPDAESYIAAARKKITDEEVLGAWLLDSEDSGTVLVAATPTTVRAFEAKVRRLRGLRLGDELAVSPDLLEHVEEQLLPAPA